MTGRESTEPLDPAHDYEADSEVYRAGGALIKQALLRAAAESTEGLDPTQIMAEHHNGEGHVGLGMGWCAVKWCNRGTPARWPCEPYRLAEALAAERARADAALHRSRRWAEITQRHREARDAELARTQRVDALLDSTTPVIVATTGIHTRAVIDVNLILALYPDGRRPRRQSEPAEPAVPDFDGTGS